MFNILLKVGKLLYKRNLNIYIVIMLVVVLLILELYIILIFKNIKLNIRLVFLINMLWFGFMRREIEFYGRFFILYV